MAEGRMLKKIVSTSRKLAELKSDSARLLWTWILPHLDIEGRFSADPNVVKGSVVPRLKTFTPAKIEKYLLELHEKNLIFLYNHNEDRYLEFVKFSDFQSLRDDRESPSVIPPFDDSCATPGVPTASSGVSKDKIREDKLSKEKYLDFVFLTKEEHQKLTDKIGNQQTDVMIEQLNGYIGEKPESRSRKYSNHYYVILNWYRRRNQDTGCAKKQKLLPIPGKHCSKKGCSMPAVHKETSDSGYDFWYCSEHMPEKVKEKYE